MITDVSCNIRLDVNAIRGPIVESEINLRKIYTEITILIKRVIAIR